tara:strand:- start:321 stop:515 length:195 start_codon:yes stop_codon:yes gene_type:complete
MKSPHKISMTKKEIEIAMQGLFIGAARVRAHKYANKMVKNVHRQFTSRIVSQMWNEEKENLNAA